MPACVRGARAAALQTQLLPGLHRRGLGEGRGQRALSGVQPRVQPETEPGEKHQAEQHRGKVQRAERRQSAGGVALHSV